MSGKAFNWTIAEEFKSSFTADQLTSYALDSSQRDEVEIRCSGASRPEARRLRQSWQTAGEVAARRIPLRRPIALGISRRLGLLRGCCLALEKIPGSVPLSDYLRSIGPGQIGFDPAGLFLAFSARLRKHWTLPADFNMSDVLVSAQGATPTLYLADAGRLSPKRRLSGRQRVDALLILDAVLWGRAPSRQQLLQAKILRMLLADWLKKSALLLSDAARELRLFRRHQHCLQPARAFSSGGICGQVRSGPHETALLRLAQNPEPLLRSPDAVLKSSATTTAVLASAAGLPFPVYIKRYNHKGMLFGLKYLPRRSRARRVWDLAHGMQSRPEYVPDILAYADRRRLGLLKAAYLVTRAIAPSEYLDRYVEINFPRWGLQKKNCLLKSAAALLQDAHGRGIVHGDLKAKNILVGQDAGREKLWLIDFDAARVRARPSFEERCRDLARLNSSFLDTRLISCAARFRFLKSYLRDETELRPAWNSIGRMTEKKLNKSGRAFQR